MRKNKLKIITIFICGILIALGYGWQTYVRRELLRCFEHNVNLQAKRGIHLSYDNAQISGWPWHLILRLDHPIFKIDTFVPIEITGAKFLSTVYSIFHPTQIHFSISTPVSIHGTTDLPKATVFDLHGSYDLKNNALNHLDLQDLTIFIDDPKLPVCQIQNLNILASDHGTQTSSTKYTQAFQFKVGHIKSRFLCVPAIDHVILDANLQFTDQKKQIDQNTHFEVSKFELLMDPLCINFTGAISLDHRQQLLATITGQIQRFDHALKLWSGCNYISHDQAEFYRKQMTIFDMVNRIQGLAAIMQPNQKLINPIDKDTRVFSLTLQDKTLSIGSIAVTKIQLTELKVVKDFIEKLMDKN